MHRNHEYISWKRCVTVRCTSGLRNRGNNGAMIAVIFEFTPAEGRFPEYMKIVDTLREDLAKADGFISLERFESITNPGKFVSLQFWRDEESVRKWRNLQKHREE